MCGHWESMPKSLQGMGLGRPNTETQSEVEVKKKKKAILPKLGHECNGNYCRVLS